MQPEPPTGKELQSFGSARTESTVPVRAAPGAAPLRCSKGRAVLSRRLMIWILAPTAGAMLSAVRCRNDCEGPGNESDYSVRAGIHDGYMVSAPSTPVGPIDIAVQGTGSAKFHSEGCGCPGTERCACNGSWNGWVTEKSADGGIPVFADQADCCNFAGAIFARLAASGVHPVQDAFQVHLLFVANWRDANLAVPIAGDQLREENLGESVVVRGSPPPCGD